MKLRVGLVGLGEDWQRVHRPALRSLQDRYEVRAVCASVSMLAEQAAKEFDASTVDGFRALTMRSDIDAILMLAPESFGPLPIFAAAEQGKAVYCAAPLEFDLASARTMKRRVEESGIAFMAALPRRNSPATLRLKELIATRLGEPRLLFCHSRRVVPNSSDLQAAGDESMRDLTELADWCRYVIGAEPTSVIGVRHQAAPGGSDDYQMMSLDFSPQDSERGTGPLAHISTGRYLPAGWRDAISFRPPAELQVCCEHGVAFLDLPHHVSWFDAAGEHRESLEAEQPVGEQLLTLFYRAVTSLVRKTSDLEDAYRALRVVLDARRSVKTGSRVTINFD